MIQHRKHHTSKVHYCSAALGLSVSFYPEAFGCQLTRTARRASQVTSLRLNSGAIGSNFEFENSTIWYSTQTASELEGVVTAAESARDAASDVRFAYGPSANPNGTSAVSSKVGMISEILFPMLPSGTIPNLDPAVNADAYFLKYNRSAVAENGVPCIVRNDTVLKEWPQGAVVVRGDGSSMTVTEDNSAIDSGARLLVLVFCPSCIRQERV